MKELWKNYVFDGVGLQTIIRLILARFLYFFIIDYEKTE